MELITALLILFGGVVGIFIVIGVPIYFLTLVVHSALFNTWKENFSKESLKKGFPLFVKFSIIGTIVGGGLLIGISQLKSWWKK